MSSYFSSGSSLPAFRRYNSYSGSSPSQNYASTPSHGKYGGGSYSSFSGSGSSFGSRLKSWGYGSVGSDTSSAHSFAGSYGGSNKTAYEPTSRTSNRYTTYDSGGGYDSTGASYRSPSRPSLDRSMSYINVNQGNVTSLKSMFDVPTRSRERYSSVERFSGREPTTGYSSRGYGSDAEVGSMKSYGSYDYGGKSYGASSDRSSRMDYSPKVYGSKDYSTKDYTMHDYGAGRDYGSKSRDYTSGRDYGSSSSSRDYGKNYGLSSSNKFGGSSYEIGSSYNKSKQKASDYVLTPFETRRTATARESSLTPFSRRLGHSISQVDSSKPSYERQSSVPPRQSSVEPVSRATPQRQTSVERTSSHKTPPTKPTSSEPSRRPKNKEWIDDESSDSAHEPENLGLQDPNVRFLTSRASSPMEPERDIFQVKRQAHKNRRRFISRTKTKVYPRVLYRRRRDRPRYDEKCNQADSDEIDKHAGVKPRYNRNKFREKLNESKKKTTISRPSSGYSSYGGATKTAPQNSGEDESRVRHSSEQSVPDSEPVQQQKSRVPPWRKSATEKTALPKQSGYVGSVRPGQENVQMDDSVLDQEEELTSSSELDELWQEDMMPSQSSYLDRRKPEQVVPAPVANEHSQVLPLTPENLSLSESIAKVKSWKKQLQRTPPETPVPPEGPLSPGSKGRSRTSSGGSRGRKNSIDSRGRKNSGDRLLSEEDEMKSKYIDQHSPRNRNKLNTPQSSNSFHSDRSPSPYDNMVHRSPSPYDNIERQNEGRLKNAKSNHLHPLKDSSGIYPAKSAESMASYGDISSLEDGDDSGELNHAHSMASLYTHSNDTLPKIRTNNKLPNKARSMESLATRSASITSLPDLIIGQEGKRHGPYISQSVQDIDAFLGFSETEDEDLWSDEDDSPMARRGRRMSMQEGPLSPVLEDGNQTGKQVKRHSQDSTGSGTSSGSSRSKSSKSSKKVPSDEEIIYISDLSNIDDFLGNEIVSHCTQYKKSNNRMSLHLDVSQDTPTAPIPDLCDSTVSLLDTPVPETPDVPLSPNQLFGFPPSSLPSSPMTPLTPSMVPLKPSKIPATPLSPPHLSSTPTAKSLDQLNDLTKQISDKKVLSRQHSKTQPALNLDDLDNILDTLANKPKSRRQKKRNESHTFELFTREAKDDLKKETQSTAAKGPIRQTSEDILVDVDDVVSPEPPQFIPYANGVFPDDYSSGAIRQALRIETEKNTISISELLKICTRPKSIKPPWIEDEEERAFTGYKNIIDLLEDHRIDVKKLEDCAFQLYKYNGGAGDYSTYLDLETSLEEQWDELDGFTECKKNAIILRTQLSVRVHACIERLLISTGRDLRRALFSLKQIFQDDKDLVHEFVNNDGLECLIKVGSEADQNYQNYILRALGQVMLYVDGMNGVISHNETVQWLYALTASKFRLVVKTALKLLLVFVEYTETNTLLLINAITEVDQQKGRKPWANMVNILNEKEGGDTELLVYAITLINKAVNAVPDQDTFYDMTDLLEEQGMEQIIQRHMNRKGGDLDLLEQFQMYEAVLKHEDGEDDGSMNMENIRKTSRIRSEDESRKSRRYSTGTTSEPNQRAKKQSTLPPTPEVNEAPISSFQKPYQPAKMPVRAWEEEPEEEEPPWRPKQTEQIITDLPRRRRITRDSSNENQDVSGDSILPPSNISNNRRWMLYKMKKEAAQKSEAEAEKQGDNNATKRLSAEGESLTSRMETLATSGGVVGKTDIDIDNQVVSDRLRANKDGTSVDPPKLSQTPGGDLSGLIGKAKEGLSSSNKPFTRPVKESAPVVKKSDSDLQWDELEKAMARVLKIADMDFTDLSQSDDINLLDIDEREARSRHQPPPPPQMGMAFGKVPPPPPILGGPPPPPFAPGIPPPPPPPGGIPPPPPPLENGGSPSNTLTIPKNKKTVRLHWKEARAEFTLPSGRQMDTIWKRMNRENHLIKVDTDQLEHLFEVNFKELKPKQQKQGEGKKEITVLDPKRSNAINIGLTVLPPIRTIKTAILKMDGSILNRECIEKIVLTMIPSEEEKNKILEAQMSNPDVPLGSAEQFLLTLSSITELEARLKLWAFKLDYDSNESEIAEPLMDLKQGIEDLRNNKTFKFILALLLSVGNFLNGVSAKGFTIDYLQRVPEVKDTVHKHSLLHHLVNMVVDQCPGSTDLYSELGTVARCSKVEFDELAEKLRKMECECKASWDYLRAIAKYDTNANMRNKLSEFLSDCAERIIVMKIVHQRVLNRFNKFLLYLGYPPHLARDVKVNIFCKVITEFSLEYRTTRDKVVQMREKRANQRERKKTRGKMILETEKFSGKPSWKDPEEKENDKLTKLLHNGYATEDEKTSNTKGVPGVRVRKRYSLDQGQQPRRSLASPVASRRHQGSDSEGVYDTAEDDILDAVVRSAATASAGRTRQRTRARNRDRKSLRSTRELPSAPYTEEWFE